MSDPDAVEELVVRLVNRESVVEAAKNVPGATIGVAYGVWKALFDSGRLEWSPYSLVQERVAGTNDYPWKVIVLCALMNRTHARQVRPIVRPLFERWRNPGLLAGAGTDLEELIRPLGFYNRRAETLRRMSDEYFHGFPAKRCSGVGQFGADALEIFVDGRTDLEPEDGFLGKYVRWKRTGEVLFDKD